MDFSDEGQVRARDRIYLELANRSTLLALHAWVAITVGLAMALTGAPMPIEHDFGPWARMVVGGWAFVFGVIMFIGTVMSYHSLRGWVALVSGTVGLSFWHSLVMFAYIDAAFDAKIVILKPGQHLDPDIVNRGYIPLVYLGYVMLVLTHAVTLILLDRPRR